MQTPSNKNQINPKKSNVSIDADISINNNSDSQPRQSDTPLNLFIIYLKGMAMGMADIVPGVSGGTIALITGIYNRLINAISSVDLQLFKIWRQQGLFKGFISAWQYLDATFVVCLALGIGTSIITMASLITHYLENEPLKIWSLFFGLVIATVIVLLDEVKNWNWQRISLFLIGVVVAIGISSLPMVSGTPSLPYLFFAGSIAVCAVILPGVSGAFILLLLGAYHALLEAVHARDFLTIGVVVAGMVTGLLIFSKFLKWLLSNHYQPTLAVLIGFIAGSLVKIYPWKIEVGGVISNVAPSAYPTGANWGSSIALMMIGAGLVFILSWWGKNHREK